MVGGGSSSSDSGSSDFRKYSRTINNNLQGEILVVGVRREGGGGVGGGDGERGERGGRGARLGGSIIRRNYCVAPRHVLDNVVVTYISFIWLIVNFGKGDR
uniref:Uncharacterized protein n=1 Tax=Vespula pensylvanica TaxID=30213 RepID=A0A834P063_VESPE|nr:hypothetical protein H0235_008536 [Vespula pensylvanica]